MSNYLIPLRLAGVSDKINDILGLCIAKSRQLDLTADQFSALVGLHLWLSGAVDNRPADLDKLPR